MNEQEEFDIKQVKVHRTLEGTVIEALAAIMLVVTWIIALVNHQFGGPMHENWMVGLIVATIAVVLVLVTAYYPVLFNNRYRLRNIKQVAIAMRMNRVLALELALMLLINAVTGCKLLEQQSLALTVVALILMTALVFSIFIYKEK